MSVSKQIAPQMKDLFHTPTGYGTINIHTPSTTVYILQDLYADYDVKVSQNLSLNRTIK